MTRRERSCRRSAGPAGTGLAGRAMLGKPKVQLELGMEKTYSPS